MREIAAQQFRDLRGLRFRIGRRISSRHREADVTASMRSFVRLIVLTLVVGGLIVGPVSIEAHAAMVGSKSPIVAVQHQVEAAALPCDHAGSQKKPAGLTHHPDCCIAGTCGMNAGIAAAAPTPAKRFDARSIAYAPSVLAEPLGVDAIPTTHPPKAAA